MYFTAIADKQIFSNSIGKIKKKKKKQNKTQTFVTAVCFNIILSNKRSK